MCNDYWLRRLPHETNSANTVPKCFVRSYSFDRESTDWLPSQMLTPDSCLHYLWRSFSVYDPFRQLFIKQRGLPNEKYESKFSSSAIKEKVWKCARDDQFPLRFNCTGFVFAALVGWVKGVHRNHILRRMTKRKGEQRWNYSNKSIWWMIKKQ